MIAEHLIQKALIAKLRTNNTLIGLIGSSGNIKEDQYQDTEFTFPAIRINMQPQTPIGDADGREKLSTSSFSIITFSEKASSFECSKIMNEIIITLFGKQIIGTNESDVNSFHMIRLDLLNSMPPLRINERLWRGEIFMDSVVHPI